MSGLRVKADVASPDFLGFVTLYRIHVETERRADAVATLNESLGELADEYVKGEWLKRDFRYAAVPKLKSRGFFTDQDIIADWSLPRIPYYADFLEKCGTGWGLGLRIDTGCDMWCLMLQRGARRGAYQAEEQAAVLPLADIASRAATLSRQLLAITEQLGDAVFYIDRFGRVSLRDGRIAFPDVQNDRLMRHVDAAIWPDLRADDEALRPVAIRQPGRHPLVLTRRRTSRLPTRCWWRPTWARSVSPRCRACAACSASPWPRRYWPRH